MKVRTFMAICMIAGFGMGYIYGSRDTARAIRQTRVDDMVGSILTSIDNDNEEK